MPESLGEQEVTFPPEQCCEGGQAAVGPLQASKGICSFFHGYSQGEQIALFRNCSPSSKCKGNWKLQRRLSRGLQPWAFLQMHFSGRRKAGGWFADGLKILPEAQEAG